MLSLGIRVDFWGEHEFGLGQGIVRIFTGGYCRGRVSVPKEIMP